MARRWDLYSLGLLDDQSLLLVFSAGESLALKILFHRQAGRIFDYALSRGLSKDRALEIVQQVFLNIQRSRKSFNAKKEALQWLFLKTCEELKEFAPIKAASSTADLEQFEKIEAQELPSEEWEKLRAKIADEKPNFKMILLQVSGLHVLSTLIALFFFTQFGLRWPLHTRIFSDPLMTLGIQTYYFSAGFLYLALSFVFARLIFPWESWLELKKWRIFVAMGLALVSLFALSALGTPLPMSLNLNWLLGAYLGAAVASIQSPSRSLISRGR